MDELEPEARMRLQQERSAASRRLAELDSELAGESARRLEALELRMGALESALRQSTGPVHPSSWTQPVAVPRAGIPYPSPQPVSAPVAAEPPPYSLAPPAAPAPPQAPPANLRWTVVPVDIWPSPLSITALASLPPGTAVYVTGVEAEARSQVDFGAGRLGWINTTQLDHRPVRMPVPVGGPMWGPPPAAFVSPPSGQPWAPAGARPWAPASRPPLWQRPGFVPRLLAVIGAAVTLIGVAFGLTLAAQYGYFPPAARTIAAGLLAVALILVAFVVHRRDPDNPGAPALLATGIAAAYLCVVAATVLFGFVPPLVGVNAAGIVGLAGIWLARRWESEWVASIVVLGGLALAPWIGAQEPVWTIVLMVVLTAVTAWLERDTGWRVFPFARVLPTALWLIVQVPSTPAEDVSLLVVAAFVLAATSLASAILADSQRRVVQLIAVGLMAPAALPALLAALQLDRWPQTAVLGVLALGFGTAGFLPKVDQRVRWGAAPLGALFALTALLAATENRFAATFAFALATVYLGVAARSKSLVNLILGAGLALGGLGSWVALLPSLLWQRAAQSQGPEEVIQSAFGLAALVVGLLAIKAWTGSWRPWMLYAGWGGGLVFGAVTVIIAATWLGSLGGAAGAGFQVGQAIVTVVCMVLCVVLLRRGLATKENPALWLRMAVIVVVLALAKLFLFDLATLPGPQRVFAFLGVGLLLLLVGTRYARAWERVHGPGQESP